jgi:hypothetical protein
MKEQVCVYWTQSQGGSPNVEMGGDIRGNGKCIKRYEKEGKIR